MCWVEGLAPHTGHNRGDRVVPSRARPSFSQRCPFGQTSVVDMVAHEFEIRISKSETNPKSEIPNQVFFEFHFSGFELVSDFAIRVSNLKFNQKELTAAFF